MEKRILAPSILSADFGHLERDIREAQDAGAEYIHYDVMDGQFVPSISFGMPVLQSIRPRMRGVCDVHLMICQPEKYVEEFAALGADIITVHAEATAHLHRVIQQIKNCGKKAGVALNPSTPLNVLDYVAEDLDMVLLMTVNPGFGGQKYIPAITDKIRSLRSWLNQRGLARDIEVDGGINASTIMEAQAAGANIFVAGSAVFRGDITDNVKNLLQLMHQPPAQ